VGALGHYLEEGGVATTGISLIREHTEAIKPPRALWVPFTLGRPFAVPHDPAFQRRVLLALLRLLEAPSGPVLVDYPEQAPHTPADAMEGVACPVSFGGSVDPGDLGAALAREIEEIAPWYDLARQRRGRTTVGASGVSVEDAARIVGSYLNGEAREKINSLSAGESLKLAYEDIRAYYFEAAGARPGGAQAHEILRWFWFKTAAGRAFAQLQKACLASRDESAKLFASRSLVPNVIQRELPK
jgi:hypothetical protein